MADEKSVLEQFKGMKRQDLSEWERWGKKWFFRLLMGIPVSLFLVWLIVLALANHKLDNARKRVAMLGDSLNYEDYAPPAVPDEENATLYLEKASQIILKNRSFFFPRPSGYGGGYPGMGGGYPGMVPGLKIEGGRGEQAGQTGLALPPLPNSAEDIKDLESWRTALADSRTVELLKIIDEAALLENARYDTDYTVKPASQIGMPSYSGYIDLIARLLIVRATLAMADGNPEAAYKDMALGYRLAYWVGQEHPGSANAGMSNRAASRFWDCTQRLYRTSPPDGDQRNVLLAEATKLAEAEFALRGMKTQRIVSSDSLDPRYIESYGGRRDGEKWLMRYPLRPGMVAYDAYITDCYTDVIELMRDPIYEQSLEQWQFHKDHPTPWYLKAPDLFIPFFHAAPPLYYRLRAEVSILQIACILEDYREEKGNYPESLDVLADVPPDPFGGEPFHYLLSNGGYILYSISANLQDDGGTPPTDSLTMDPDGDIVWTMQPE